MLETLVAGGQTGADMAALDFAIERGMVFSVAPTLAGGSKKMVDLAHKHGKPVLHLARDGGPAAPEQALRRFILDHGIKVLNVAGPRASKEPEVASFVTEVLTKLLAAL